MPLWKTCGKRSRSHNIRLMRAEGRPQKQAVAIALETERRASCGRSGGVSIDREQAGEIVARALRGHTFYDARVRALPGSPSVDVFVDEKRTRVFLASVMVVPNPNAPGGFYWSAYGPYASNVARDLRKLGLEDSESPRSREAAGRAGGEAVAEKDRRKVILAVYRAVNVSDKHIRGGKHTVMLVGGPAERYGVSNYTSVVLEELDSADLLRIAEAYRLFKSQRADAGRAGGYDGWNWDEARIQYQLLKRVEREPGVRFGALASPGGLVLERRVEKLMNEGFLRTEKEDIAYLAGPKLFLTPKAQEFLTEYRRRLDKIAGRAAGAHPDRLFIGVYPTGIVYSDRKREKHGDYMRLAFLPYSSLALEWSGEKMPDEIREEIERHAASIAARRGERFETSASGQSVILGSGKPGRDAGMLVLTAAVIVGALLLLRPLFKDAQEAHRWNMEHDPVYRRTHQATEIANAAANIGSLFKGNLAGRTNRRHVLLGLAQHFDASPRYASFSQKQKAMLLRFAEALLATGRATSTDALAITHGLAHTPGGVERLGRLGVRVTVADVLSGKLRIRPVPVPVA